MPYTPTTTTHLVAITLLAALSFAPRPLEAAEGRGTRLVTEPAVSGTHIAFSYASDIYVARRDGTEARRLTAHPGVESGPHFSPDGKLVAFTGEYDGNTDVFVVPLEGGAPRRLTFHPGPDIALGFTPDGASVLFSSPREVHTMRHTQLFTVPVDGGAPTKLPVPHAYRAAFSADGTRLAIVPLFYAFTQWKHYRGGTTSRIFIFDMKSAAIEQIPQPGGRSNDADPTWVDGIVHFRSDRDGEFNLYAYDPSTKNIAKLTSHNDFPVLNLAGGAGVVVYEQAGALHLFDPKTKVASPIKVSVTADLIETRPRFARGVEQVRAMSLSPSGARTAVEFRGEILTVPREKGDDRNLTNSPGAHERSPAWSPDGKSIAYFSDAGGEYRLVIAPQDGKGKSVVHKLKGAGFYFDLKWSPDARHLSYSDNAQAIWVADAKSGDQTRVGANAVYGPWRGLEHAWSPDSRWLAHTRNTPTWMNRVWIYDTRRGESFALTDGIADATSPAFDKNGKYLYFLASTNAGPVREWFSQANLESPFTAALNIAVLAKSVPSPLAKESDEEAASKSTGDEKKGGREEKAQAAAPSKGSKPVADVQIDRDGILERIVAAPIDSGPISEVQAGDEGHVYFLRWNLQGAVPTARLVRFDLKSRKEEALAEGVESFQVSANGKRILVRTKAGTSVVDVAPKLDLAKFRLPLERLEVRVDPRAEWRQIFDEAWRINRDYFYDPGMHGADWPAMREKYAAFLPHLSTRADLNRVMQWMFSELAVGHHRVAGGDMPARPPAIPGGLLGADFDVAERRYRLKRIYGGLNWDAGLRSPLTEPGVNAKVGEVLIAVDGRDLRADDNLYARFERTAGRIVELTIGPKANGDGARVVKVVPVADEHSLRNRAWVEANIRKVTAATKGRVAYVYVPNTSWAGRAYFKRYFYPQADREAIIIDERHNGGGLVADYYIDLLRRPYLNQWVTRYGADQRSPAAAIHGPKVMIIDETAGSGGDLLPWIFRKLKVGTIVGRRTWGGLVGILGFPPLIDGGWLTAPNIAFLSKNGWRVENEGVPPDVEIEQTPADVLAGSDPQLDKAIEIAMKELAATPKEDSPRPAFPVRVQKP
ncbi:MAG: PD40 domain-containing protein [Deltaproteobacteria bacterium]|nr:PD40 domain-containing protein [Deltaproteobacteria bacterium]